MCFLKVFFEVEYTQYSVLTLEGLMGLTTIYKLNGGFLKIKFSYHYISCINVKPIKISMVFCDTDNFLYNKLSKNHMYA
jgi:hypothetical protein